MATIVITPEAGRALFFFAVIVFVGWFAAGMMLNVRKGNAMTCWMQEGLPLIGEKTTHRWLGSSGVELKLQNPSKPFSRVELFILLEPRDVPFLWAYFHARGRRDVLIVRCHTHSPRFQLEVFDPKAWTTRDLHEESGRAQWSTIDAPGAGLIARGEGRVENAAQLAGLAAGCGLPLVRLGIRRSAPELEVQWEISRYQTVSSRRLFENLRQIAQQL